MISGSNPTHRSNVVPLSAAVPTGSKPAIPATSASFIEKPHDTPPGEGAKVIPFDRSKSAGRESKFRYHDAHFHPWNYVHQGPSLPRLIEMMDSAHMGRCVLAPLPTRQMMNDKGESFRPAMGEASCGCTYYILDPKIRSGIDVSREDYAKVIESSPGMAHDTECDTHTAIDFLKLSDAQKKRFDPMVTGLNLGDVRCSESLIRKLADFPGVFTGVGEVTIHKEFVQDKLPLEHQARLVPLQRDSRNFAPHIEPLLTLIQTCGDIGMPMIIHNDAGPPDALRTSERDATLYFDPAVKLYQRPECRNTTIIWAHAGGAGKYSHLDDKHVDRLDKVLGDPALQHVNIDLSWDVVAHQLTRSQGKSTGAFDETKAQRWAALFDKYPDRVLFGSDTLAPRSWEQWDGTAKAYDGLMDMVKPSTARMIRLENYERIFDAARVRVRAWEKYCMPIAERVTRTLTDTHVLSPTERQRLEDFRRSAAHEMRVARVAMELELANHDTTATRVVEALQAVREAASHGKKTSESVVSIGELAARQALRSAQQLVDTAVAPSPAVAASTHPLRSRL
jgi:predicted TIM-barrel fold metal-dependent hydrolase